MIVAGIIVGIFAVAGLCVTAASVGYKGKCKSEEVLGFALSLVTLAGSWVFFYTGGHRNGQIAALTGHANIELTAQADGTTQWTTKETGVAR